MVAHAPRDCQPECCSETRPGARTVERANVRTFDRTWLNYSALCLSMVRASIADPWFGTRRADMNVAVRRIGDNVVYFLGLLSGTVTFYEEKFPCY